MHYFILHIWFIVWHVTIKIALIDLLGKYLFSTNISLRIYFMVVSSFRDFLIIIITSTTSIIWFPCIDCTQNIHNRVTTKRFLAYCVLYQVWRKLVENLLWQPRKLSCLLLGRSQCYSMSIPTVTTINKKEEI